MKLMLSANKRWDSNLCKLDESDAQRPDVHLEVVGLVSEGLAQHDFRRHPKKDRSFIRHFIDSPSNSNATA